MNDQLNQQAYDKPEVGDYWHEMFSPYFLVVWVNRDKVTVLNCLSSLGTNARISVDEGHWSFDFDKAITVDHNWIKSAVKYKSYNGFVADVVRSPKMQAIADAWRIHKAQALHKEWEDLTGWTALTENYE